MREKVVLIGAGSAMFTGALLTDIVRRGWECELGLVDIDPDALAVAEGLAKKVVAAGKAPVTVSASTDRRDVLPGATVVITTIAVGGRRAWEQDVVIPRKHGIYQPVGDSVMPGGTSRCLRIIPPMVEIAEDVLDLAPQALFFNYANPMTAICRAVRKETGAPIVGLCSGVNSIGRDLARQLEVDASDFEYTAVGLNHLTWFTELRAKGQDVMPRLKEIAKQELAKRESDPDSYQLPGGLCWQLLQTFGAFPAVGDGHVLEFFPSLFPKGEFGGKKIGVEWHPFENIITWGDGIYEQMKEKALSKQPLPSDYFDTIAGEGEHEQCIDIIESIRQDKGEVFSANLPNSGQAPNLPPEAVLEAPTMATAAGMKPIAQPPLPSGVAGTLASRLGWVEAVTEAALEGSREKFIQALVVDGWVKSIGMAQELADELLTVHAERLPRFKLSTMAS
jgi:alpha-galactosidase